MFFINVVKQYERAVVFRLGRYAGTRGAGLLLLIPFIDHGVRVDMREQVLSEPAQSSITQDNALVDIDYVVYMRVVDAEAAIINVQDFTRAVKNLATTTLRSVIGDITVEQVLSQRDHINQILQQKLSAETVRWGVEVKMVEIREITPAIEAMGGSAASELSNGGMATKLIAGRIAMAAGCRMAIADGRAVGALGALIDGKARCSWFLPDASPLSARKKWIKGSLKSAGALIVDDGAVKALSAGRSLLPAGVTAIDGEFKRGDVVEVKDRTGRLLARGLVAYAAEDARRIAGHKSAEIERLLGFRGRDEMVHRDDLVVE